MAIDLPVFLYIIIMAQCKGIIARKIAKKLCAKAKIYILGGIKNELLKRC